MEHAHRLAAPEQLRLQRRIRGLAWLGLGWHFAEFAVALWAGLVAGSIALLGFALDSFVETIAGIIVLWLFTGLRLGSPVAERRAQQLIATSFVLIGAYVGVEALRSLLMSEIPKVSWVGISLAAFTSLTMPLLAKAKRDSGRRLHSPAAIQEAGQTMLCSYLSWALLAGLGLNALFGWWWADPLAALVIAVLALRAGRSSWRGEGCCGSC